MYSMARRVPSPAPQSPSARSTDDTQTAPSTSPALRFLEQHEEPRVQTAWIAAEACKIKDGVFMGNVMAVQDSGFILSNKICTVIKCQKGFTVPKRLRNAGVQYSVINLLEAFLDDSISDDTKDHMLEGLYAPCASHRSTS
jgi:hypothetical protein